MRRVVIMTPHYAPSSLVCAQRARLWARHLAEFGWQPVVVTTHHRHYREPLDWDLLQMADHAVEVHQTAALPVGPGRLVSDLGIRGFPFHYRALSRLARRTAMDFLLITVPPNYSALLGGMMRRRYGVPFGIDYQDPWVEEDVPSPRQLKAWGASRLARWLEPEAIRDVSLICGVSPAYYRGVIERHGARLSGVTTAAMPVGTAAADFEAAGRLGGRLHLFDPQDGHFHLLYAGTMWSEALPTLQRFLEGVARLRRESPEAFARLRVHFVGTGRDATSKAAPQVRPSASRMGLQECVCEHPARIPYADALRHLTAASANIIFGGAAVHYAPSKVAQLLVAGRPIFALLHEGSEVMPLLGTSGLGTVVPITDAGLPTAAQVAEGLARIVTGPTPAASEGLPELLDPYTARGSARSLAAALDEATAAQGLPREAS